MMDFRPQEVRQFAAFRIGSVSVNLYGSQPPAAADKRRGI